MESTQTMPNPSKLAQIVLFGDSLTEWSFDEMGEPIQQPQLVLFGASMTEWSFDKERGGFGWVMQQKYGGKAVIVNEGELEEIRSHRVDSHTDSWDRRASRVKQAFFR